MNPLLARICYVTELAGPAFAVSIGYADPPDGMNVIEISIP